MVRHCQVCGKLSSSHPELSFHRFPVDPERRNIWLSLTGVNRNHLPKHPEICSDHFHSSDLIMKTNGLSYVRPGANPKPLDYVSQYEESISTSSDSTIYGTPPRIPMTPNISVREYVASPMSINSSEDGVEKKEQDICQGEDAEVSNTESISVAGPSRPLREKMEVQQRVRSPSTTDTATEAEAEMDQENIDPMIFKKLPTKVISKKRKRSYVGDLSSSDFSTPEKRRKNLAKLKETVAKQRKRIHSLQVTVRRLRLRITSLQSLLKYLKEKSLISESSESTIKASLSGPAEEIFKRFLKGPSSQKYNPSLRSFALTLSFYSAKAYNFVRKTFNRTLPHLGTISKWYRSIDGSPGFTKEALMALTLKQKDSSKPLLCNLVMDEMSIRRQVEWTGQKFTGYVDIGTSIEDDTLPEAREVLVFMVVCLNGSWKVPIAYFLLNGLSALTKAGLVRKCLEFIHESGVIITSFTFDGAPVNMTMAEELGADFTQPLHLKTSFKHPVTGSNIYICLDACHMLKLVRNCMASQTNIRDANNEEVKWSYVVNLVDRQNVEGLHAATKVRMRHLQWAREKMKVRLATQTISRSVSDAITFLRNDLKLLEFKDSEATSKFLLKFNNLFDILNSRNRFVKYEYKKPFSPKTAQQFLEFLIEMKKYIVGLTLNGTPIIKSSRKTGFLGFLICIESIQKMYEDFVVQKKLLKYILTYKLSQDHLELFFGSIRSRGGYNNNPTARQFEAAYKRLLVHSQISAPNTGNAVNLEEITILTCGSGRLTTTETGDNLEESNEFLSSFYEIKNNIYESFNFSSAWDLTIYVEDVVTYIAGFVVKSLKKCVNCPKCLIILETDITSSRLQVRKTYGSLVNASKLVIETCKAAEKFFREFHKTYNIFNKNIKDLNLVLINNTMRFIPMCVYDYFGDHLYDEDPLEGHAILLIKLILKTYYKIRIYHETAKNLESTKKNRLRSINTKTILFRNE